jgi:hypothetical protein
VDKPSARWGSKVGYPRELRLRLWCVPYYYQPVDQVAVSWQSARYAMQDTGLSVVTADEASGVLVGRRGNAEGTIIVRMRSDGRVGVEITSRDPDRSEGDLTQRLTDAYNRRMGR